MSLVKKSGEEDRTLTRLFAFAVLCCATAFPQSLNAQEVSGVRCVAKLPSGIPLIVRMSEYSRANCEKAVPLCAQGLPVSEFQYFDQLTALMTPSRLSGYPGPAFCDFDPATMIAHRRMTAADTEAEMARSAQPSGNAGPQIPAVPAEKIADFVEKLTFPPGEETTRDLVRKRGVRYSLYGYMGQESGFSEMMFDPLSFQMGAEPEQFLGNDGPDRSGIVAIFTDFSDVRRQYDYVARVLFQNIGKPLEWREAPIFDGGCILSQVYVGGQLQRVVAWIELPHASQWRLAGRKTNRSYLPAACLVAGIGSFLGLHNIGVLHPDEMLNAVNGGEFTVAAKVIVAIKSLYGAGITDGMSRTEVRERVIDYWNKRDRRIHELE